MPEIENISTFTDTSTSGANISIRTQYLDPATLPDTLSADITEEVGSQDGVSFIEGKLLIKMKNSPSHLSYQLDNNGHLILIINTGDGAKYSIDNTGHLIYTTTT